MALWTVDHTSSITCRYFRSPVFTPVPNYTAWCKQLAQSRYTAALGRGSNLPPIDHKSDTYHCAITRHPTQVGTRKSRSNVSAFRGWSENKRTHGHDRSHYLPRQRANAATTIRHRWACRSIGEYNATRLFHLHSRSWASAAAADAAAKLRLELTAQLLSCSVDRPTDRPTGVNSCTS